MPELALVVSTNPAPEPQADFESFWCLYPRKVAKKDARKAWDRVPLESRAPAITAVVAWRRVWAAKDTDFIPHPATWLNGERWEDELPKGVTSTAAAHVAFAPSDARPERAVLPDHVKAAIAKLKGPK